MQGFLLKGFVFAKKEQRVGPYFQIFAQVLV
jgi:hypothetical protein